MSECKLIAEVSSNHAGDIGIAKQFIRKAANLGLEYVKFQSSRYEDLVDKNDFAHEWVKQTSLSDEAHFELIEECQNCHIEFLTTCFSIARVRFLSTLGINAIKVASPDLLSFAMIEKLATAFDHIIISTGMHTKKEIKEAIAFLEKNNIYATLLHAISLYPTPLEKTYMEKFLWLKDHYSRVGYSNHTNTIEAMQFALCNGADIIEAHLKLSDTGPGRVTAWDISPDDFREVTQYRESLTALLGQSEWNEDESFLFPEEKVAREKFIGRWGDNT